MSQASVAGMTGLENMASVVCVVCVMGVASVYHKSRKYTLCGSTGDDISRIEHRSYASVGTSSYVSCRSACLSSRVQVLAKHRHICNQV